METKKTSNLFSLNIILLISVLIISFLKVSLFQFLTENPLTIFANTSVLVTLIFFLTVAQFLKGRLLIVFYLVLSFSLGFLLFVNLIYFRYFNSAISFPVLLQYRQLFKILPSIPPLIKSIDALFFIDVFFAAILIPKIIKNKSTTHIFQTKLSKCLGVLLALIFIITENQARIKFSHIEEWRRYNQYIISNFGVFNFYVFDGIQFLKSFSKPQISHEKIEEIKNFFKKNNFPEPSPLKKDLFGIAKGKNVIVIIEESLQAFVLDKKVNGIEITPNLNSLKNESIYFSNFYDQTNEGRSSDSEFCSLTSLHPLKSGAVCYRYPNITFDSLPKILKENGYHSIYAYPCKGYFWNREVMAPKFGFESIYFERDFELNEMMGWGLTDNSFFKQMMGRLEEQKKPFFAYLLTLTNHTPFEIYDFLKELEVGPEFKDTLLENYLHSVHFVDGSLGNFLNALKKSKIYKDSIIVVYGDHDANIPTDQVSKFLKIGNNTYNIALLDKVPFLIHIPGFKKNGEIKTISGTLDTAPTLLFLLGINPTKNFFLGKDIFEKSSNDVTVLRNGSALNSKFFYLKTTGQSGKGDCYLIEKSRKISYDSCEELQREAQTRLDVSDTIIGADLLPTIKKLRD